MQTLSSAWLSGTEHNFRSALGIVLGCWPGLPSTSPLSETFCSLRSFPLNRQRQDIGGKIKSPPISQHWIKQNLLPPTHCCLSLTTKTTCQSLPTQKALEFSSKVKTPQNFSSPPGTNCRNSFRIICCYSLWNGWMNQWEVREWGISCTKNMPQIKMRKFCSSLEQHLLARTVKVSEQKL